MQLKRVFPDSLTIEMDPEPRIQERFWEVSRLCARCWNQALELRRGPNAAIGTRQAILSHLQGKNESLREVAPSVLERVLWSLDEAFEQYQQAERDYAAGKRGDMPAPPRPHSEDVFFPLLFTGEFIRFEQPNCLELRHGDDWIPLVLPKREEHGKKIGSEPGIGDKVKAVLIMYHPDRKHFEIEINPILADIRD